MEIEIFLLIGSLALIAYFLSSPKQRKELKSFKGPSPLPLLGNVPELISSGKEHVVDVISGWVTKFGRRFKIRLGPQSYVIIVNAEDTEKILSSQVHIDKAKDYDFLMPWLGTGLLTSQGQKWHGRRKMLTPAFHFKILEDFLVVMNEQSAVMVDVLKELGNKTFNVFPYVTHAALDIICESAMGKTINAQRQSDSDYVKAVCRISELIQYRQFRPWLRPDFLWNLTSAGKEEAHILNILHSFTTEVINEKKLARKLRGACESKKATNDEEAFFGKKQRLAFLDLLLDAQEKDPQSIQDLDIREETDTFMFEGHDTTAANVNWTVFLLGHFPDVQQRVHEELDQIFGGDKERPVTMEDLTRMKYLELCIKESLRIYPSVPFIGRAIKTDCPLDANTVIPSGTVTMLSTYHLHRDPRFFPDPEKFNPDRFLPENIQGRHPFAYVPFSAGPRNCIGQKFALMEEKVLLSSVFRNFRVKSMERREDVALLAELIMRPRDGLKIQLVSL